MVSRALLVLTYMCAVAVAMKHSVATQKASYDLEAQLRLTEKAFAWAEQYAQRCDSQDMSMEEDTGVDADAPVDDPPEQGSDIHITSASTPAGVADLFSDSAPSSPSVVQPIKAVKRKAAPTGGPMATLKAMSRGAPKQQKKGARAVKRNPAPKGHNDKVRA